jgi:hypothetical protein
VATSLVSSSASIALLNCPARLLAAWIHKTTNPDRITPKYYGAEQENGGEAVKGGKRMRNMRCTCKKKQEMNGG